MTEDGNYEIEAAGAARGLGFEKTEIKNGKEYKSIRWANVNSYLQGFGFRQGVVENDFIPEQYFYLLSMKAESTNAVAFQRWIAFDVLPVIRKHGVYATDDTIERMLDDPDFAIKTFTKLKEEKETRKLAEQKVKQLEEVVDTKQTTIELLTNQLIQIADRTLLNALVRDRGGLIGYQEAYRSLYSLLLTRCSIDLYRRSKFRNQSKIDCIDCNEWAKVIPVTVAWFLENDGSQAYLQELVKGKVN